MSPDSFKKILNDVKSTAAIEAIIALRVDLKKAGRKYKACCPFHNEKTPSFIVDPDKNNFKCYGCDKGGDAIQFLIEYDGLSFKDAVYQIAEYYGIVQTDSARLFKKTPPPAQGRSLDNAAVQARKIMSARKLLKATRPAIGTLVEAYLKSRAIDPAFIPDATLQQIRFHPKCAYWHPVGGGQPKIIAHAPAMIAPMQNSDGEVCAAHITYLKSDGSGKAKIADPDNAGEFLTAKKMRGAPWGCVIRLGPADWGMQFAEGIENGLSAMICKPDDPVWVTGSLGNMAGSGLGDGDPHPNKPGQKLPSIHPDLCRHGFLPPPECGHVILIADNDMKDPLSGEAMMARAERRMRMMGFYPEVLWPPAGMDLNDVMMGAAQ